ncbi:probable 3-hydroxyisobutyryl-CoA hydrolase 2 [Hevea brasiliensis]|uniref:probable 3-hydroxyisobutyryl-CoA hydrolase 2 n=1 Tax=Hevea brasiliensis TaxID=3981 RepID=UPI0025F716A5|nr:probable 3-hydroxyisobutyryl-CoA hydrolase 2 [Hevea brasiliensis]
MASTCNFKRELNKVLFEGDSCYREVILNRPSKLNSLDYDVISQMLKNFRDFETDSTIKFVILKANGKAFSAGGDVVSIVRSMIAGHWSFGARFYKKQFNLDYLLATYKKPLLPLIDGFVMGGGAGLSMNGRFRIVTENAVFAMPEVFIGLFPDVGASHFLSRLPGHFGEYLGLTGARLNGAEMVACGLATHFVFSKDLPLLENTLQTLASSEMTIIYQVINKFTQKPSINEDSIYQSLETINKCFSKDTVEEILLALEKEAENKAEIWITKAINSIKAASPTSLKIALRSIREGRLQNLKQCLICEYTICCNVMRATISNDFYEGSRAMLFDKDKKPKWQPSNLELVSNDMVDRCFTGIDDDDWKYLQIHDRSNIVDVLKPKL